MGTVGQASITENEFDYRTLSCGPREGVALGGVDVGLEEKKVRDEHEPSEYLCVAIRAYDSRGNMVMIENPEASKLFRILDLVGSDDRKAQFRGWGD